MIKNLFNLAEIQLNKEKKRGVIPFYTMQDVVEYAVEIRSYIDKNPRTVRNVFELTKKQKIINHREAQKRYSLRKV